MAVRVINPSIKTGANTKDPIKIPYSSIDGTPTIPTKTSQLTNDSGFLTSHQDISGKLDKTTYEENKTIDFGSTGVLKIGKFKVYDTNVSCEITSTTSVTYSGKLVIATQNYVIQQMTVYGDAANTIAPNIFVKPSTTSDPYIEIYFKPAGWSKNVIHIYGSGIQEAPTGVCTNVSAVPSTATQKPINALNGKANLSGGNTFSGQQTMSNAIICDDNQFLCLDYQNEGAPQLYISDAATVCLDNGVGTAGQVFTSGGSGTAPEWKSIPTYSLSGTTLTITLP